MENIGEDVEKSELSYMTTRNGDATLENSSAVPPTLCLNT